MNVLLDDNSDIVIIKNTVVWLDIVEEIKQKVVARLRAIQGDWFLDLTTGIPYYTEALKKGADLRVLSSIFKNIILSTSGVDELQKFTMDFNGRTRVLSINTTFKVNNTVVFLSEVV